YRANFSGNTRNLLPTCNLGIFLSRIRTVSESIYFTVGRMLDVPAVVIMKFVNVKNLGICCLMDIIVLSLSSAINIKTPYSLAWLGLINNPCNKALLYLLRDAVLHLDHQEIASHTVLLIIQGRLV